MFPNSNQLTGGFIGDVPNGKTPPSKFPFILSPYADTISRINTNANRGFDVDGDLLGLAANSHDLIYRITAEQLAATTGALGVVGDLLGGDDLVSKKDPEGNLMIGLKKGDGSSSMYGNYVYGVGAGGYGDCTPFSVPNAAGTITNGQRPVNAASANFLIFISAYVVPGSDILASDYAKVGFDCGGQADATNGQPGAFSAYLGQISGYQHGALVNAAGPYEGAYGLFPALSHTVGGVHTRAFAVNGTGTCFGSSINGPDGSLNELSGGSSIGNSSASTPWTSPPDYIMVNLGDNLGPDFGVYSMGAINYSAAISQTELNRVTRFLNSNKGKLPYWWQ